MQTIDILCLGDLHSGRSYFLSLLTGESLGHSPYKIYPMVWHSTDNLLNHTVDYSQTCARRPKGDQTVRSDRIDRLSIDSIDRKANQKQQIQSERTSKVRQSSQRVKIIGKQSQQSDKQDDSNQESLQLIAPGSNTSLSVSDKTSNKNEQSRKMDNSSMSSQRSKRNYNTPQKSRRELQKSHQYPSERQNNKNYRKLSVDFIQDQSLTPKSRESPSPPVSLVCPISLEAVQAPLVLMFHEPYDSQCPLSQLYPCNYDCLLIFLRPSVTKSTQQSIYCHLDTYSKLTGQNIFEVLWRVVVVEGDRGLIREDDVPGCQFVYFDEQLGKGQVRNGSSCIKGNKLQEEEKLRLIRAQKKRRHSLNQANLNSQHKQVCDKIGQHSMTQKQISQDSVMLSNYKKQLDQFWRQVMARDRQHSFFEGTEQENSKTSHSSLPHRPKKDRLGTIASHPSSLIRIYGRPTYVWNEYLTPKLESVYRWLWKKWVQWRDYWVIIA